MTSTKPSPLPYTLTIVSGGPGAEGPVVERSLAITGLTVTRHNPDFKTGEGIDLSCEPIGVVYNLPRDGHTAYLANSTGKTVNTYSVRETRKEFKKV
jgi:hypothetical protein